MANNLKNMKWYQNPQSLPGYTQNLQDHIDRKSQQKKVRQANNNKDKTGKKV